MAVNKVEIYVSQILEDLDNGFTWLKRDDIGYGSIQEKYNAKDQQIAMIRKHPKLKDAETNIIVFTVIDDTNGSEDLQPEPAEALGNLSNSATLHETSQIIEQNVGNNGTEGENYRSSLHAAEATDAFANL